eukprot:5940044-Pyramimonas_sp.AAC.1
MMVVMTVMMTVICGDDDEHDDGSDGDAVDSCQGTYDRIVGRCAPLLVDTWLVPSSVAESTSA